MLFLKNFSCCTRTLCIGLMAALSYGFVTTESDYRFESADNEVAMEVKRENAAVNVSLRFSDATKIANVTIEKSNDALNNFSRCSYIGFDGSKEVVVIKKRDNYPLACTSDAFYRLRLSFTDGSERVYPPVRLPAITQ